MEIVQYLGDIRDQECHLINYMEAHTAFCGGEFLGADGVFTREMQWNRLSQQLNRIGPPKSTKAWQRFWTELKSKARHYNAQKNKIERMTGNDTEVGLERNENYERVLKIMGIGHNNGLSLIPEVGIYNNMLAQTIDEDERLQNHSRCLTPQSILCLQNENSQSVPPVTSDIILNNAIEAITTTMTLLNDDVLDIAHNIDHHILHITHVHNQRQGVLDNILEILNKKGSE